MVATESRKIASEQIWNSLPRIIRQNIEDAVNAGELNCEIIFYVDEIDKFYECIKYFNNLNELGYKTAMHKEYDKYTHERKHVITIIW